MKRASLGDLISRISVSAKGRFYIGFSYRKLTYYGLYTSALPRWHVISVTAHKLDIYTKEINYIYVCTHHTLQRDVN